VFAFLMHFYCLPRRPIELLIFLEKKKPLWRFGLTFCIM